ncbi:carboxylate--amine ligase [Streptomyces flavofungini]|uniref:carboxylate--amine ligase n=1 Tax=Streptomyces flavofungini TaxID=68200 RepID=UPI0025B1AF10|nr:ATP-grasp domain-containing protein [Streptomyces flavofungini]WJV47503.1 ATP-grasp domain-containing protein [Streptomyces flavofungini]
MHSLDTRVPAVLLRIDRNPFHHGTLGAVRSLGRDGVEVHLVADDEHTPVARSRHLHRMHPPPAPAATPEDVRAVLLRVAARVGRPAVLIPLDDAGALAVDAVRDALADRYLLPRPAPGLPGRLADKAALAALCARLGVAHPPTVAPTTPADAAGTVTALGAPVVAKWSRPWLLPRDSGLRSAVLVRSPREAADLHARTATAGSRLLLQAYLPGGPDADWFVHGYVGRDGEVFGGGTGRKLRARPRAAGLTAVGEWADDAGLWALARRLLAGLGYRGVFDLDFRRDARTGTYHLLDFNPRPGAQFRLFADGSGTDVVRAAHLDLTHRPVPAAAPLPGRAFVVENYAPLTALRTRLTPRRTPRLPERRPPAPEFAWSGTDSADDPGPAADLWRRWRRHVLRRARARLADGTRNILLTLSTRARETTSAALPGTPLPGTPLSSTPLPGTPLSGTPLSGTTNRERAVSDA